MTNRDKYQGKPDEVKREIEKLRKKKNYEKYDNSEDALKAFEEMCFTQKCTDCQYRPINHPYHCVVSWLYDEAEEDGNGISND